MPDLESLGAELRAVADPPAFAVITTRARTRRRRRAGAAIGASVLVAAGVVAAVAQADRPAAAPPIAPEPTSTGPSADEVAARAIIDDPHASFFARVGPNGDVLGVYGLGRMNQHDAVAIRRTDGTTVVAPHSGSLNGAEPVPGGWIVTTQDRRFRLHEAVLRLDGTSVPLGEGDPVSTPEAGDVPFVHVHSAFGVYRPSDGLLHRLPTPPIQTPTVAVLTDAGTVVMLGNGDGDPGSGGTATLRDGTWRRDELFSPEQTVADLAGTGDVVALMTYDALAISRDGATSWTVVPTVHHGTEETSLAVTHDGTVIAQADDGLWVRVAPDGELHQLPGTPHVALQTVGRRVYGTVYSPDGATLQYTSDDGDTWHDVPLPGR